MKYLTKFVLKGLSLLSIVMQIIFSLAGAGVLFAGIMLFLVSGDAKSELYQYVIKPEHLTRGTLLVGCFTALIIFISLIVVMRALRKVLNNIYQKNYFVADNLLNIKVMLAAWGIFTLANVSSLIIFAGGSGRTLSRVFADSWSQVGIYTIFLAILYTLYLVFKYGVALQTDSNTVI